MNNERKFDIEEIKKFIDEKPEDAGFLLFFGMDEEEFMNEIGAGKDLDSIITIFEEKSEEKYEPFLASLMLMAHLKEASQEEKHEMLESFVISMENEDSLPSYCRNNFYEYLEEIKEIIKASDINLGKQSYEKKNDKDNSDKNILEIMKKASEETNREDFSNALEMLIKVAEKEFDEKNTKDI